MSLATSNRDGGRTSESGHLRALLKGLAGEVLTGLAVSQRGAGANMSVDVAIGDAMIPRSDGTYGHPAWNDAVLNKTITTADVSNPRRDIVVLYIDYGQTPSTGVSNNTNGVVKCIVVAGTPAGSPADPSDAALQSAVGASNPFVKLARVRVAAAAATITNSVIDDLRTMAQALDNGGWNPLSQAWDHWTYSAYDSTYKIATITVPASSIFTVGQKVKYWQLTGGWKYGFIVELTSGTSIKVYQGHTGGYTLNNERIYLPAYSRDQAPDGFDRNPTIWSTSLSDTTNRSQSTPVGGTIYSPGALSLPIGLGLWKAEANYSIQANRNSSTYTTMQGALSNANNTMAYNKLRNGIGEFQTSGNDTGLNISVNDTIAFAANGSLFPTLVCAGNVAIIYFLNGVVPMTLKATCAYL